MFEDMQIGMCVPCRTSLNEARSYWRQMDQLGFDRIGIADTPMLAKEVYLSLGLAAMDSPKAKFILMVSNPITRDITVTAGAIRGLLDVAGDRTIYGFGIGDSSVVGVGLRPAPIGRVGEYIASLRDILAGGTADFDGRKLRAAWGEWEPLVPRMMMGVGGERNLRAAGRTADVVMTTYGILPNLVEKIHDLVHEGAVEAGRDPAAIDIWHLVTVMPGETLQEGFANINILTQAKFFALHGDAGKNRPPEVQEALRRLAPLYGIDRHSGTNEEVWEIASETGTVDYFVQQAGGMVGPVDYTAAVERMRNAGVKNLMLVGLGPDKPALINAIGQATVCKRNIASIAG